MATEKAENICKPYLEAIKLSGNNDDNDDANTTASEAWEKISIPGFYLMEDEEQ